MQTRFSKIKSVLIADCGSNMTRVALIEVVDQGYRFVARGEAPSTLEEPFPDVTLGVLNAIRAIEDNAGRRLLSGTRLITRRKEDGSGVDAFVASSERSRPFAGGRGGIGQRPFGGQRGAGQSTTLLRPCWGLSAWTTTATIIIFPPDSSDHSRPRLITTRTPKK